MEVLEIITLRSLESIPDDLVRELIRSLGTRPFRLYRRTAVGSDLSLHLAREVDRGEARPSDLGVRLAAALREHGQVSHSVWEPAALGTTATTWGKEP